MNARSSLALACLLCSSLASSLLGQPTLQPSGSQPAASPAAAPAQPNLVTRLDTPKLQALAGGRDLVQEVQKMLEGGADSEVVKAYVLNWTTPYTVTSDDILRLHDHHATTEVLTSLIRRSGELQAQRNATQPATQALQQASAVAPGVPDYTQPQDDNPPAVIYPYPSSYPAYTYSYLYPDYPLFPNYAYSYWAWPYSFGYYSYWPYSHNHYWPYHYGHYGYSHYGYGHYG